MKHHTLSGIFPLTSAHATKASHTGHRSASAFDSPDSGARFVHRGWSAQVDEGFMTLGNRSAAGVHR